MADLPLVLPNYKEHEYYNQLQKESSQEPRFVLVVVYFRGPPICWREGGNPFC